VEALLLLALREDFGAVGDLTSLALVPSDAQGAAAVVARQRGVLAGLPAAEMAAAAVDPALRWSAEKSDGQDFDRGECVARIAGSARSLLMAERLVLNLLGRLSGIATLTRAYVEAVAGTRARIYDTRKTTPGWRRLEKYAVRCGGGRNHRSGLFEAVLIKDNHLAFGAGAASAAGFTPGEAVAHARRFLAGKFGEAAGRMIVEVEVDTLEQLEEVLPVGPDIVLLDNMPPDELRRAVRRRDELAPTIELEASGGINLATVRAVAESGVDRISAGALTHSAGSLDFGLDWQSGAAVRSGYGG
jgi:nicotinate-nucleotide pyrophosphorylase (carboxylating)